MRTRCRDTAQALEGGRVPLGHPSARTPDIRLARRLARYGPQPLNSVPTSGEVAEWLKALAC
jgi:hypothetical protein